MFVLGGFQTDFAQHAARAGNDCSTLTRAAIVGAFDACNVDASQIDSIHVANAFGELLCGQAHMATLPATVVPSLWGVPAMRHEAACASGSIAILCAMRDILAGHAQCALVVGVEQERHVPIDVAARALGSAAWQGHEHAPTVHMWPHQFAQIADVYADRHGLRDEHLRAIAKKNFANAKHNPNAQTRHWSLTHAHFGDDATLNPSVSGRMRRQDCSQLTDGAAAIVLASETFVKAHFKRHGTRRGARVTGFGHRTGAMPLAPKIDRFTPSAQYLLPEVRNAITDAYGRAGIVGHRDLDGVETHDCFTISEYVAVDHFGITAPGKAWEAIENGATASRGVLPFNQSGGLIGAGHPVGATGVRMVLDATHQVTGQAGAMQVEGAKRYATLNIGGSAASAVCFIVEGHEP